MIKKAEHVIRIKRWANLKARRNSQGLAFTNMG